MRQLKASHISNVYNREVLIMFWYGIDLRWAYADLLPSIYRQTYCKHHAYDILHDALVRFALTKSPHREQQPHAYLRTITQNLVKDGFKERARYTTFNNTELSDDTSEIHGHHINENDCYPSAEHLLNIKQRLLLIQNIMDKLPPKCKQVFWLYRIESMPQQEIAIALKISKNMVQRHVMRAMLDLLEARDLIA